jgi:hypothetical protein
MLLVCNIFFILYLHIYYFIVRDVSAVPKESQQMDPFRTFSGHTAVVNVNVIDLFISSFTFIFIYRM